MKVSIAITTYNYAPLLAQAIDSVLSQTIKPYEIVVVDDYSQDKMLAQHVCRKYGVRYLGRGKNLGLHDNFNDILNNVFTGDYCMYLGSDNWLHPTYIEETQRRLKEGASVCGTDCYIVGEYANDFAHKRGGWFKESSPYDMWHYEIADITKENWLHGSSLFNRMDAIDAGGFMVADGVGVDWDMWKNLYSARYKLDKVDLPLLFYRMHRLNFTQHNYRAMREQ